MAWNNEGYINVIELFAGIGAATQGIKEAINNIYKKDAMRVRVIDIVECDKDAINVYNHLHGKTFKPKKIEEYNYLGKEKIDIIHLSPPCQPFSVAGKNKGEKDKRGGSMWYHALRIIEQVKPKYVIMENVKGLISEKHKTLFDNYINKLSDLGYQSVWEVLDAKNFDCAQQRERVFVVSRLGRTFFDFKIQKEPRFFFDKTIKDIVDFSEARKLKSIHSKNIDKALLKKGIKLNNKNVLKEKEYSSRNKIIRIAHDINLKTMKYKSFNNKSSYYSIYGKCGCISASDAEHAKFLELYNGYDDVKIAEFRHFTFREMFLLFGWNKELIYHHKELRDVIYKNNWENVYKRLLGNSIVVTCYTHIIEGILEYEELNY